MAKLLMPPSTLYRRMANHAKSVGALYWLFKQLHVIRRLEVGQVQGRANIKATDVVCDIGCGDGYWACRLGRHALFTVGLDPFLSDVTKASRFGRAHSAFVNAVAEHVPLSDASVDKVVSVCVFEHCFDDKSAFAEAYRILKPGGTMIATVDSLDSPYISEAHRARHRRDCYVNQLYDLDSIRDKLQSVGFRVIEARYLFGSWLAIRWEILLSRFGAMVNLLSPFVFPFVYLAEKRHFPSGYKILVVAAK